MSKILRALFLTSIIYNVKCLDTESSKDENLGSEMILRNISLCENEKCFSKCCAPGFVYRKQIVSSGPRKKSLCVPSDPNYAEMVVKIDEFDNLSNTSNSAVFANEDRDVVIGMACVMKYKEHNEFHLLENGYLYIETPSAIPFWTKKSPDEYCIDTFVFTDEFGNKTSKLDALVCMTSDVEDHQFIPYSACMLVSCVFILATLAVYAWLPELRNLHGRVLMAYLSCLFVGFAFLATMQILLSVNNATVQMCLSFTFIIYFSLLSAFFWLNVMSFDIWWTFSGKRGLSLNKLSTRGRFYAYALYSFGIPSLLTILMAALEFSNLPAHPLLPLLRQNGCFIHGTSKLLYLYGPILILSIANLCFFIMTAVKIAMIRKQTSVLKSKESSTHDPHRNDRQRLLLNVKLFVVMGASWILEVISAIYPEAEKFWRITDMYNILIGLITFIIFVCKRKIFRLIKKRYRQVRGLPMSRSHTQTTSTSRASKEDLQLGSVKT